MRYNRVNESDLAFIRSVVGEGRLWVGDGIGRDYWHDELGGVESAPEALIQVENTEEVAALLRHANERRIPVVARGSGTGLVGGAVPLLGGLLLDFTHMNRILELDETNLTVTVQPGVLLMELQAFAAAHGLLYPPDPGEKSATIGGNISTNAGGMRAVKYGVTREYVRGLTVVTAAGETLHLGSKVVKNSSGYALKDLVVGSEGTLAIVTEAILRLLPEPACTVSLLLPYESMEAAIRTVPALVGAKAAPTAIEYMSRETILFAESYLGKRFPDTRYPAYLLLTFDGASQRRVEEDYEAVAELCLEKGAVDALIVDTQERKDSVWNARGAFLEAIKASTSEMDECDVVVPRSRIADYIHFTHELAQALHLRIPSFGHAGDGNLHIYVCRDELPEAQWKPLLAEAFQKMYAKAAEMGGQVSGEHGIGWAKRSYLAEQLGETQMTLMRGIKAAFDPNHILNPGKVCP